MGCFVSRLLRSESYENTLLSLIWTLGYFGTALSMVEQIAGRQCVGDKLRKTNPWSFMRTSIHLFSVVLQRPNTCRDSLRNLPSMFLEATANSETNIIRVRSGVIEVIWTALACHVSDIIVVAEVPRGI